MTSSHGRATQEWSDATATEICEAHRSDRGPLMPILHHLQEVFGYIDPRAIAIVADDLNLSEAEVYGVVGFYKDFRITPGGRTTIRICRGEACQSMGSDRLVAHAQEMLGIRLSETTADGSITLEQVFCLGNCTLSPAAQFDKMTLGRLDVAKFNAAVSRYREAKSQ